MKQLKNAKELIGKTISQIVKTNEIWIKFDDDSFVVFDKVDKTEGFSYTNIVCDIYEYDKDKTCIELLDLNVITLEEHNDALNDERIRYEKSIAESDKKQKEHLEKYEKEQLEILKNKYETK